MSAESSPEFPPDFMKGVGMSVFQNSSDQTSNWAHFIKRRNYFGQAELKEAWEKSNDFWNLYEDDIKLAKDTFGTTSFRFSFEWARLEPNGPGEFDPDAVERFTNIVDCIIAHGMEPNATMHHFTHPQWFEDMGGFEKEENIAHFVSYAKRLFGLFSKKIKLWSTFNEPTCFSFVGYIAGLWCPGKMMAFTLAGKVLLNLLKTHVETYKVLKAEPGGDKACIGLVHQHIKFQARENVFYVNMLCSWMTYWFASETILRFFTTGEFEWKAPFWGVTVKYSDPSAVNTLDWWGINYYSRPCVSWMFGMGASLQKEDVTDIDFRIYPQGLYESIKDASVLRVPIYVTENGLADKEDKYRKEFIEEHFKTLARAIHDGYDVRGYYAWTLMDNIEWHEGFHVKYGLFEWDPVKRRTEGLKMRGGSQALADEYQKWPNSLSDVKEFVAGESAKEVAASTA